MQQHPEICLREDVISTINILKRLRKKYDNTSSRQFFEKVKIIRNYGESGLEQAIDLLYKEMPDVMSMIDKQYIQRVKEYAVQIYKLFLKESVLSNQLTLTTPFTTSTDLETIISHESAVMYKKEAFIMAVNFLYAGIFMNDEGELYKSYIYIIEKIDKMHTFTKTGIIAMLSGITFLILDNFLKQSDNPKVMLFRSITAIGLILYAIISFFFMAIYEMWHKRFRQKKVKQTFNVL